MIVESRFRSSICSARALGDYPIKALTLDVGIRRPLGVGAGGLAILCALPEAEADEIIDAIDVDPSPHGCDQVAAPIRIQRRALE